MVAVAVYLLKDFKADFKKLTEGLASVSESLQILLTKDTHKNEQISELKEQMLAHSKAIGHLKIRIALLEQKTRTEN